MIDLPSDLLAEVFLRLPADTLANLKKVSKSWRALIDSPEFISLHLSSGRQEPRLIFLTEFPVSHYSTAAGCEQESPDAIEASRKKIQGPIGASRYHGSCNGLICLGVGGSRLVLWNPCTRQHKELPPDKYPRRHSTINSYGFGHDIVGHDDYKVVKISQFYDSFIDRASDQQVQIYSLKTNSWREGFRCPYRYYGNVTRDGVFANGALHWIMVDDDLSDIVMALDLTMEKWHVVPQPEGGDFSDKVSGLAALDGCLCLVVHGRRYKHTQMWMMKQKDSWTKMSFKLPETRHVYRKDWTSLCCKPMAYSGKILIFLEHGVLMWYDTERDKLVKLNVFDSADHSPSTQVTDGYAFTASLVKLP